MDNRYGVSPLMALQLLEPMIFILPIMLWLLVIGPLFIYPLARWKANREGVPDPHLGLKVALHYFRMIAFQLLLLGGLVVLWAIIRKSGEDRGDFYRVGFGILVPAAIIFGAHILLLGRTNDQLFVTVRRLFLGYNLLITGLLGLAAAMLAFQALFAKGSTGDEGRLCYAALLVYVSAWVVCAWRFMWLVGMNFGASAGPPQNIVPPSMPPAQASSGGGLPSLGGGFPPVGQ